MKIIKKITFFLLIICLVGCAEFFPTITPTTPTNSETILETNYLPASSDIRHFSQGLSLGNSPYALAKVSLSNRIGFFLF